MIHRFDCQRECAPDILLVINHQHAHAWVLAQLNRNENAAQLRPP
jgi:hypothetical protein